MIVKQIRDLLVGSAGITGALTTYEFAPGVATPAVFTVDPIPKDADLPAIIITQPSGVDWGTLDKRGAEVDIDVRCYADKDPGRSSLALRQLAWNIWELLGLATFTMPGYGQWGCFCTTPPTALVDPDGFPGYLIPLMVRILED